MSRAAPVQTATNFEAFLEFEKSSSERHEFVDGNLFVMAGGTVRHNLIASELHTLWNAVVRSHGCRSLINDVLVRTPSGIGYYPDVFVTCEPLAGSSRVSTAPSVIVEVLSESTEVIDRGEKWLSYQLFPSLEQYVLLSQHAPLAELYSRQSDGSWRYEKFGQGSVLRFLNLNLELPLDALYADLPAELE